ncbi:hypothetical protein HCU40_00525 [Pseudanabaena biceps]|nr:hypothetical protein [Pseudanabaena biceps]
MNQKNKWRRVAPPFILLQDFFKADFLGRVYLTAIKPRVKVHYNKKKETLKQGS